MGWRWPGRQVKSLTSVLSGASMPRRSVFREKIATWYIFTCSFSTSSGRGWGVLLDQLLGFQFSPEFGRNPGLHRGIVREDLLFTAGAND
jgi:hypothetical protein